MKVSHAHKSIFLALFLGIVAYLIIHYNFYLLKDPKRAIDFINSFHPYDDFVFIIIQIFQVLIGGIIPGELSEFIGGYIYGTVLGTVYSALGLSIGSWLAFILARKYGLPLVKKVVLPSVIDKYDSFMEHKGRFISFILFLIPGFPKAALCYIIGLSQMNIWIFIAISTFGRLLGIIIISICGSSVRKHHVTIFIILLTIMSVILLLAYFYQDRLIKTTESKDKEGNKK